MNIFILNHVGQAVRAEDENFAFIDGHFLDFHIHVGLDTERTCDVVLVGRALRLFGRIKAAIDKLLKDQPRLFDFTDTRRDNWPRVVNLDGYTQGIAKFLTDQGLCARFDGKEMAVKETNDYNDQYAVLLSETWIRRGTGIYRGSCYPSSF